MRHEGFEPSTRRHIDVTTAMLAATLLLAVATAGWLPGEASAAGETATVRADGRCLHLRAEPGLSAAVLTCLPDGTVVRVLDDGAVEADGHRWRRVDAGLEHGWVAEQFLAFRAPGDAEPDRSTSGLATITYYYCERGENEASWGDGGGFCGMLRSGAPVYEGAAACSAANFGQRFRIVGDPTDRTYTCEDTGSAIGGDHRDIWFQNSDDGFAWLLEVGPQAEIVIVNGSEPQQASGEFSPEPTATGLTITLFEGSLAQLVEAGEALSLTSCFATVDGSFMGHSFGAPAFVNETFSEQFSDGLGSRPLVCRRP